MGRRGMCFGRAPTWATGSSRRESHAPTSRRSCWASSPAENTCGGPLASPTDRIANDIRGDSMKKNCARLGLISILMSSPALGALAQASSPTAFLTTAGKDTLGLEQFVRRGNVVSGTWVVLHPPGVYVHDYRITLADDGLPVAYTMRYSTPGAPTPPGLDSVSVTYGRDSATLVSFRKGSTTTRRTAMREAFPLLGQSYVGVELALERLRRMHLDSSTVVLHAPTEPNRSVMVLPVRFFSDSATIGEGIRAQVSADGNILGFRSGPT